MSKQRNYEVIRENELGYLQTGDYFIPDLKLPQENRSIGKYGRMHRDYLQEHNPLRFDDLYWRENSGLILQTLTNRHRTDCS